MNYKVAIGVLAQVEEFKQLAAQIPDKSKLIVFNGFDNPEVAAVSKELEKEGSEYISDPTNPGAAAYFNIALAGKDRKWDSPMREGLDYVIILSPSCIFNKSVEELVWEIERAEAEKPGYYYWAPSLDHLTDMHCFAVMRRCVEGMGLFDENIVPYSYEDCDHGYRGALAGQDRVRVELNRHSHQLGGGVSKDPRLMRHYQNNVQYIHDYYVEKWGGIHTQEKFLVPFNDESLSIKYWERNDKRIAPLEAKDG